MNKQMLLEVADLIENAPPEQFHMGSWFGELIPAKDYEEYEEIADLLEPDDYIPEPISFKYVINRSVDSADCSKLTLACNTTACIAGWTIVNDWFKSQDAEYKEVIENMSSMSVIARAADLLELTNDEASQLFFCEWGSIWTKYQDEYDLEFNPEHCPTWNIHPKHAADILRRLANGEIKFRKPYDDDDEEEIEP